MGCIVDGLIRYIDNLKGAPAGPSSSEAEIEAILKDIMRFVGEDDFKTANPQYSQGDWYTVLAKQLIGSIVQSRVGGDWSDAIDEVEGIDSVPIMTTHKSKGLEYHTVVFVGLEDVPILAFDQVQLTRHAASSVAMSRAAKRVIFTFSGIRSTARNGGREGQQRESVKPLYALCKRRELNPSNYKRPNGGDNPRKLEAPYRLFSIATMRMSESERGLRSSPRWLCWPVGG